MTELIGRFHPLLVHIPIGILVLALFMSLLPVTKRDGMKPAFSLALAIAALTSALACIAGYLLANSGDYEPDIVQNHQWAGIATCILSFAAWLAPKFNRQILWGTAVVLIVASHLGGTLTHGEGYLLNTEDRELPVTLDNPLPDPTQNPLPDSIQNHLPDSTNNFISVSDTASAAPTAIRVNMYRDEITPLLKSKCYNCHSAVKKKGGLRLDSESFISKGGKNGDVLVKGNPDKSPLYSHLLLPLEDDKHMPPKGKKQLNRQEIELIHRWIKKGAPFGAIDVMPIVQTEVAATAIKPLAEEPTAAENSSARQGSVQEAREREPDERDADKRFLIPAADEQLVSSLREQGIIVEKINEGSNGLAVNFVNVRTLDESMLKSLNAMNQQVTVLKFTGQPLSDQMLNSLSAFPNLQKLQVEKTNISDEGLGALKNFPRLETVNLYGTKISDQGLRKLNNRELKKINLWNTNVSEQGIKTLLSKYPGLEVEAGQLSLKKPDSTRKKS